MNSDHSKRNTYGVPSKLTSFFSKLDVGKTPDRALQGGGRGHALFCSVWGYCCCCCWCYCRCCCWGFSCERPDNLLGNPYPADCVRCRVLSIYLRCACCDITYHACRLSLAFARARVATIISFLFLFFFGTLGIPVCVLFELTYEGCMSLCRGEQHLKLRNSSVWSAVDTILSDHNLGGITHCLRKSRSCNTPGIPGTPRTLFPPHPV